MTKKKPSFTTSDQALPMRAMTPVPHVGHGENTWTILVVDDDQDIHKVTQLALSQLKVHGRLLSFIHCYSEDQARQAIQEHPDIAVVLLDVVMEQPDSGLHFIQYLRDTLHREEPRIILLTGLTTENLELQLVQDYDINDFKSKNEITRTRLITSVTTAIRAYRQLTLINRFRANMGKVISTVSHQLTDQPLNLYANRLLTALTSHLEDIRDGFIATQHPYISTTHPMVIGGSGSYAIKRQQSLDSLPNRTLSRLVQTAFDTGENQYNNDDNVIIFGSSEYKTAIYIKSKHPLNHADRSMFEMFISGIRVSFENIMLLQRLQKTAYQDELTGLPNRAGFLRELDRFATTPERLVVVLLDIAHFSDINDGLGEQAGNLCLIAVANRLQTQLSAQCIQARITSDVFGIVGPEKHLQPERLRKLFHNTFQVAENALQLRATFGLSKKDNGDEDGITLLRQAWSALNHAKKRAQTRYAYFHHSFETNIRQRLEQIRQLRHAFSEQLLEVWYQPQVNLANGRVLGMEALLRWRHEGQFISPEVFIPLAEHSGLIVDIGSWVFKESCKLLQRLEALGIDDKRISVNVSMLQFRSPVFVQTIQKLLKQFQVRPRHLELEITESVVMDDPQMVINVLNQMKTSGLTIAIDDFGTGFSSLSYLQKLPLDCIKIDRSFISEISQATSANPIVELIIGLAQKLGMFAIAEGVETPEQVDYLQQLGCQAAQGYLYAKPMPLDDLLDYINTTASS